MEFATALLISVFGLAFLIAILIPVALYYAMNHLSISPEDDQPNVLIPENEYGVEPGARNVVKLLREHADNPQIIRFIADMLEI